MSVKLPTRFGLTSFRFTLKSTIVDSFSISYRHRQMHSAVISNACNFNIPQKNCTFFTFENYKNETFIHDFLFFIIMKKKEWKKKYFQVYEYYEKAHFSFLFFFCFSHFGRFIVNIWHTLLFFLTCMESLPHCYNKRLSRFHSNSFVDSV